MTGDRPEREGDESSLIAKAVDGDRQALSVLLYKYLDPLDTHVRRHLSAEERAVIDVDDILQQTFTKAIQGIHAFQPRGPHSFHAWLKTIADHTRIDALRKRGRYGEPENTFGGPDEAAGRLVEMLAVDAETPSRAVARGEAACVIQVALANLDPRQRQAVALIFLEELSLDEAAECMRVTKAAVRGLVYRGLENLRAELGSRSNYLSNR
jgi:RNA polymerase sigma-70 factor (ECF subfamily)